MYHLRPFRNSDPPSLCRIWNRQRRQRGLAQPLTPSLLEIAAFSKPYFDPQGLIVAQREGQVVGFVHAGFGCSDDGSSLSTDFGVTSMLMVDPESAEPSLAPELLAASEDYLHARGAKVLYAGGIRPLDPYYLGFYGGSELPGVLESDAEHQELYRASGYDEIDRVVVMHCELGRFRAPINRQQMQLKRTVSCELEYDPPCLSWWENCTWGTHERVRFSLTDGTGNPPPAAVTLWNIEPLASTWGLRVCGLIDLEVVSQRRRQGLATYLLGEAFRQVFVQGFTLIEAQTMQHNAPAIALYKKLGFVPIDHGSVLRKA